MNESIDRVEQNLKRELDSWKTLAPKVVEEQDTPKRDAQGKVYSEYVGTRNGKRLYKTVITDRNGRTFHDGTISDGTRRWKLDHKEGGELETVIIRKASEEVPPSMGGQSPKPWLLMFVGGKPLHTAIRDAERIGETEVIGRPCDVYRFANVQAGRFPADVVYALDRETSIPLRVEYCQPGDDLAQPAGPYSVWEAKTLDSVGAHHMPLTSSYVAYRRPDESGNVEEMVRQNITVESLEYDAPIEASLFQPQIGPDVTIMDKIQGTTVYPPSAETTPTTTIPTTANASAVPPTPWSHYAPLAGIGFGLCVLAAGFLLWMRGARG